MTAVNLDVCVALLNEWLSGFQGYPRNDDAGQRRFALAFQENCISVGHVRGVLKSFDEKFPTVRQIADVAANLRPQFEPEINQRAEWEKLYGKPQAFEKFPADELAMHWQAFRDALYYSEGPGGRNGFWDTALMNDEKRYPDSVAFVRKQAARLGWTEIMRLSASPEPMPFTGVIGRRPRYFSTAGAAITQLDVDRLRESRKSTEEVDRELDGWDNPDR